MKTVYSLITGIGLMGAMVPALAQQVQLRLAFNTESNRYEVIGKSDFSAKNFTWGPSQVSVVLPSEVANEPLSVLSSNAGDWRDNSMVYSPAAATGYDFHGLTSGGGKVDLVADQEFVLFDFMLKSGYVDNVRLFDNAMDPTSAAAGMKGGDFRSYMADHRGNDYLRVNSQLAPLLVKNTTEGLALDADEAGKSIRVVAYPNPSTIGKFRLYLKGFPRDEVVRVEMTSRSGKPFQSFDEKVETLAGREINAPTTEDAFFIVTVNRPAFRQQFSQKVLIGE
ncbi:MULTISPECIES: hypothetical protein [Spirosoma]|uniref:Uncharacterized protein n=1 Tax=Spirosoma sordidisoli TaxID=2502893 RepID=A0A4Q2UNP4_9BACT|nr:MULTISPECIES: hypothetical protein [Spirosoma]RYC68429.1 hypothetical protein EQG79_18905 [Spirosoma sordidisoli]